MTRTAAPERRQALRPWVPECLPEHVRGRLADLRYVAVDEVVGDLVTLTVTPWPAVDGHGKVRFPGGQASVAGTGHLLVHRRELHQCLYRGWLLRRSPRAGDVFAAEVSEVVEDRLTRGEDVALDERLRLSAALPGLVCDITAESRNVAKLAFYAGLAGVQPIEQAQAQGQLPTGHRREVGRVGAVRPTPWKGPHLERAAATPEAKVRWELPDNRLQDKSSIVDAIRANPTSLFYFLINVGDGDTQLLLLPTTSPTQQRRVVVVDAATTAKLPRLLGDLASQDVVPPAKGGQDVCALVVATHPHDDHIEGMAELLAAYGGSGVADFWEPGYYAPSGSFAEMMAVVEEQRIPHSEPTAGMTRYVDGVKLTVLAPSVHLRTAYDSSGVDCNDSSIVMRVEFPAVRIAVEQRDGVASRTDLRLPKPWSMILGADAQTRSWSHVSAEFPELFRGANASVYRSLAQARGRDYLAAEILKVSHHASKHGINIELVERIKPQVTLISSVGGNGRYGFPHALATEAIAEALAPTARFGRKPAVDADLGIHYTGGCTSDGAALGSIALQIPAKRGSRLVMWRFGDAPRDDIDLAGGRVLQPIRSLP